ncbi:MAG: hypothetical protein KBS75_00600 [Bacteroidales bacterium]|nr:hypothetical protein [Candidatus Equimonas faecalis]
MKLLLLTLAIVAVAVVLLCLYAMTHRGQVGQHVSANAELRRRGVECVQSQDREARRKTAQSPEKKPH